MRPFNVSSASDLREWVDKNGIRSVPPRTKRKTVDSENWVICHFLPIISGTDLLEYPLCVTPGDRPDLVLSSRSGKTGIEITTAIPQDAAEIEAFVENKEMSDVAFFAPHYKPGEEKRSRDEIIHIVSGNCQNPPFMGDAIERSWIDAMLHFVKNKSKTFNKPDFAKYDKNWLLVYDDWRPRASSVSVVGDHANSLSAQLFNCEWKNPFDKVFILKDTNTVFEFSQNEQFKKHMISDLFA